MAIADLSQEAEDCRRKALSYLGQPEAPFLLHLAREFERIENERRSRWRRHEHPPTR